MLFLETAFMATIFRYCSINRSPCIALQYKTYLGGRKYAKYLLLTQGLTLLNKLLNFLPKLRLGALTTGLFI